MLSVLCGSQIQHTPDAGTVENYAGDGSELYWEFDEERGRYYVSYPDDQQWFLLGGSELAFWYLSHLDFCP